jgi:hypothetical protein
MRTRAHAHACGALEWPALDTSLASRDLRAGGLAGAVSFNNFVASAGLAPYLSHLLTDRVVSPPEVALPGSLIPESPGRVQWCITAVTVTQLRSGPCRGPESPTAAQGPPSIPPGWPRPRERQQARGGRPATPGPPGATPKPIAGRSASFIGRGCSRLCHACSGPVLESGSLLVLVGAPVLQLTACAHEGDLTAHECMRPGEIPPASPTRATPPQVRPLKRCLQSPNYASSHSG